MSGELKPCPFCTSKNLEVQFCGVMHVAVVCLNCLAVGPRQIINKELPVERSVELANKNAVIAWELRFSCQSFKSFKESVLNLEFEECDPLSNGCLDD